MGESSVLTFPVTFYFVAAARLHAIERRHMVCTDIIRVSGVHPLTREEVIARFHKSQEAAWDAAAYGPMSDWVLQTHTLAIRSFWLSDRSEYRD